MTVGREQLRGELREWVRAGAEGCDADSALLMVEGEPGCGRTTLVRGALADAVALGFDVRYAAADALAVRLPLHSALDCLHPRGPGRAAVVDLLREAEEAARPGGALLAAMDLLTAGVERRCAERPLLLVLDDAHWADPATLLLWQRLAGRAVAGGCRCGWP
ncbi:ATP-binding protein [Streptomyces nojiriensis]